LTHAVHVGLSEGKETVIYRLQTVIIKRQCAHVSVPCV